MNGVMVTTAKRDVWIAEIVVTRLRTAAREQANARYVGMIAIAKGGTIAKITGAFGWGMIVVLIRNVRVTGSV